jgi:hypothetical protein
MVRRVDLVSMTGWPMGAVAWVRENEVAPGLETIKPEN